MKECTQCKKKKKLKYFSKNQVQCKSCKKDYYQKNKVKIIKKCKVYYSDNKDILSIKSREYYLKNKQKRIKYQKEYELKNDIKIKQNKKEYYQKNKVKIKKYVNEWSKNKYKNDIEFRIKARIKAQITHYLREQTNEKKISPILGYTIDEFYLQVGFPKENEEIDHKVPISWFKDKTPIKLIWDLRNLHIISIQENRSKCNYYSHPINIDYKQLVSNYIKEKYISKI